jgi:hypothetical protein
MIDIQIIPTDELKNDLAKSIMHIDTCTKALALGIETYSGELSVRELIGCNEEIVRKIRKELHHRQIEALR